MRKLAALAAISVVFASAMFAPAADARHRTGHRHHHCSGYWTCLFSW